MLTRHNLGVPGSVEFLPELAYCLSSSHNLITLLGLRPAALTTPVEIETHPKYSGLMRFMETLPKEYLIWGGGKEGLKPPPFRVFPLQLLNIKEVNRAEFPVIFLYTLETLKLKPPPGV